MTVPTTSPCCWATVTERSGPLPPWRWAPIPGSSPWATSTAIACRIWRWPISGPTASRCCSATATAPSDRRSPPPPAPIRPRWPWATSIRMGSRTWRWPTMAPATSRCCSATAMGASDRRSPSRSAINFGAGDGPGSVAVAELNRVGVPDLAVANYYSNTVSVLLSSGRALVATPVLSPAGGTFTAAVIVTITDSTPGATIYYTTDGSTPTTASTAYTGPVPLTTTTTLKAMAAASGMTNSSVTSATYTISQAAAPPTFSPAGGSFVGSVTVTMSTATSGATIYYTTDGSTPTTASSAYT